MKIFSIKEIVEATNNILKPKNIKLKKKKLKKKKNKTQN